MLKSIAVSDVQLGMFIHKFEARWFDHPFWKSRFLLDDEESLQEIRLSGLRGVVIDTAKGRDVMPSVPPTPAPAPMAAHLTAPRAGLSSRPASRIAAPAARRSFGLKTAGSGNMAREVAAAKGLAKSARQGLARVFVDARLGKSINVGAVEPVVREIYSSVQRNPHAFSGLMRCKLTNEYVYRHGLAVSALMISLARKMRLDAIETREAGLAGLFLDIGTNYLPADPAPANGDYRNADPLVWRQHVALGLNALVAAGGIPQSVLDACLQHHECIDGSGFPGGLSGEEISRFGRMAAICDTFDYLLMDSETASALDPGEAVRALQSMGNAFDPEILQLFVETVGVYPVGSFVRLRSERIAMVIDEDPEDFEHPVVKPFYSLAKDRRIQGKVVNLANCQGEDEIVGLADLSGLVLPEEKQLRELLFLSAHKLR